MEASPTAFLMWPSARPHESFMRQSLSTLLLLLLLLLLRRCLVGTAGSPFQDPFLLLLLLLHQIPPMLLGELSVSRICQSEPYSDRLRSYRSFLSFWSPLLLLFSFVAYSRENLGYLVILLDEKDFSTKFKFHGCEGGRNPERGGNYVM